MGILINKNTKVIVQGITGHEGSFHTQRMIEYGTQVVAGVVPGKGGQSFTEGGVSIPIFNTVESAVRETDANASVVFVPRQFAPDAIMEAADAGCEVIVTITEGIPVNDMLRVVNYVNSRTMAVLIGPNCPGIVTVDECKIGIMPGHIFKKGPVGLISRSGTLTYEVVDTLTRGGVGQSTCIGIGGDPVIGTTFLDLLMEFQADDETEAVVLIGEIGGSDEEEAAEYIPELGKPVVAFISGRTAPPGKRMGHAGAIISGGKGTAESKIKAFEKAGVPVANTVQEIPPLLKELL